MSGEVKHTAVVRTEHATKYDRQMRLWGAHGQQALEDAHICVLHSGPTATETLKNLVLPKVGHFTLLDDAKVTASDCGNNFFLDEESIGQNRAEVAAKYLLEMNPDVKGEAVVRNPEDVIAKDIGFFDKFTLVIAAQLPEGPLRALGKHLWAKNIPLLAVRSIGLLATLRLQVPELCITESHPDNDRYDLFCHPEQLKHWPELKKFADSFAVLDKDKNHLSGDEKKDHAHVPYACVLINMMEKYIKAKGKIPASFEEGKQFKNFIIEHAWNYGEEENFQQAVEFAHRAYKRPALDSLTAAVLNDAKSTAAVGKDTPTFWVVVHAIREFMAKNGGNIPASTNIPDMISEPKYYVHLKELFKTKAQHDTQAVHEIVKAALKAAGRAEDSIKYEEVEHVVRNVRALRVVRTRSLEEEHSAPRADDINSELENHWNPTADLPEELRVPTPHNIHWYLAIRAADRFYTQHKRYPGAGADADLAADKKAVLADFAAVFKECGVTAPVDEDIATEIVRQGATEIHNIAAFIGGVASQEALKLLVGKQFAPINNTFLFNGMHGSALTFAF